MTQSETTTPDVNPYPPVRIVNDSFAPSIPSTRIGQQGPVTDQTIGVLFMAYGGPETLDEMSGYLADIRSGRPTYGAVLEEISGNYRAIGGKSPLPEFTRAQVEATMQQLQSTGGDYRAYIGMRHWSPWIEEAVRDMLDDGIQRAVAIVLAPHYSKLSVEKYQKKIKAALEMYHGQIDFAFVNDYHTEPGYITAMADRVRMGIQEFPEGQRGDVHVVLSAHSLPVRVVREGDPYADQLLESARLIAQQAGLSDNQWSWSYQSEGRSPEPWLGPQLENWLPQLKAERGVDKVVSIAIGFVSDHVEILFDIDIEAQKVAHEIGMTLVRPPALNTDPLFIGTLASVIHRKAQELA
ncbi:ferrochelatase [Deinococcus sp. Marseille-Q6407]|uniref:ferrochelatase n=1 Tax=Deinococcus sp. Marseille-Q6407 TaxID=2969223 RepID=UPI0021BED0F5|nr:ferrochelatase [Deinococcus sp. Marseille-Q6407]